MATRAHPRRGASPFGFNGGLFYVRGSYAFDR